LAQLPAEGDGLHLSNGGVATIPGYVSERWDWDEIRKNTTLSGSGLWHDPPQ